jgi:DNA-binding NarL/FixJ family response regulator
MVVVVGVNDVFFKSKIVETAHHISGDIVLAHNQEGVLDATAQLEAKEVILDLNESKFDVMETIRALKLSHPDIAVIGFVSHVQRDVMARAKAAGCDQILSREAFVKKLPELLKSAA